jgi:hypothetical protein
MWVTITLVWEPFSVDQPSKTLNDMSLEGVNYVQDFLEFFLKIEQHHTR